MEMESRWYLSPGQTLETTKIEDRGHALHTTKKAWEKITAHLDRNRLIQEAIDKEQAHRQALKEGSEQMTKNWDNSVENIRKRKEEERQARLAKTEEDKMQKFLELRKEQQVLRQKFIEDAKKEMYISKGYPKSLTSALIQSDVIYERQKQLELEKKIKEHEKEERNKYAQKVFEGAKDEKLENLEKEKKIREKNLAFKEVYLKDMHERETFNKTLRDTRIAKEQLDTINAEKEFKKIKQYEFEEDREKKAKVKQEFHEFYRKKEQAIKQSEMEEKEQDLVLEIYSQAKHQIQCLRKKKEREMQDALQARRDAAAKTIVAQAKAKSETEDRLLKQAVEERERQEIEKLKAKEEFRQQLIKDREEDRQKFIKREERRKFEETEQQKWDMLNRFKQNDMTKQHEEDKRQRQWQETLQYRKELFEQMAEKDEERRKVKEETDTLFKMAQAKLTEEDKQFFDYADEVYNHAKNRGRTTMLIERVIQGYKKENNLPLTVISYCEDYEAKSDENHEEKSENSTQKSKSNSTSNVCKCKCFK